VVLLRKESSITRFDAQAGLGFPDYPTASSRLTIFIGSAKAGRTKWFRKPMPDCAKETCSNLCRHDQFPHERCYIRSENVEFTEMMDLTVLMGISIINLT
jgi:hypothetical protein